MLQPEIQYLGQRQNDRAENGQRIHIVIIEQCLFRIAARCKKDALEIAHQAYLQ